VLAAIGCGDPEPGDRLDQLTLPAPRNGLELIEDARRADSDAAIRPSSARSR